MQVRHLAPRVLCISVFCGLDGQCPTASSGRFMAPCLSLLVVLRASRIARAHGARVLLLLPPKRAGADGVALTHHAGEWTLLRLCMLFLWLSHAAGCLYWYTAVGILTDGVASSPRPEVAWALSPWLPEPPYATYLAPSIEGLGELLALRGNATGGNVTDDGAAASGALGVGYYALTSQTTQCTALDAYLYSLLWGMLHVSGVAFEMPDETRGTVCCIVVALAAIATNATLIGAVTTTLTRINAYSNEELRCRESITNFLRENRVPDGLQQQIHDYYNFAGGAPPPSAPQEGGRRVVGMGVDRPAEWPRRRTAASVQPPASPTPLPLVTHDPAQCCCWRGWARAGVSRQRKQLMPSLPKALSFELDIFLKRSVFLRVPFFQVPPPRTSPSARVPRTGLARCTPTWLARCTSLARYARCLLATRRWLLAAHLVCLLPSDSSVRLHRSRAAPCATSSAWSR